MLGGRLRHALDGRAQGLHEAPEHSLAKRRVLELAALQHYLLSPAFAGLDQTGDDCGLRDAKPPNPTGAQPKGVDGLC